MGLLSKIRGILGRSAENPAIPLSAIGVDWAAHGWTSGGNPSGVAVNPVTAMTYSAVYACVRIIAETLGSIDLDVIQETGALDPVPAPDHGVAGLYARPNVFATGQVYRESRLVDHLTAGAMFTEIIRDGDGFPVELWGIPAANARAVLKNRRLWYEITGDDGRQRILNPDDILHVPLLPAVGSTRGRSPAEAGAGAIGLGLAVERNAAKIFGRGGPGVLEAPGRLDDERYTELKKRFRAARASGEPVLVIDGGLVWKPETPEEYDTIRRFQVLEVARFYGVPAILIGEAEKGAPKSSTEEQERDFARHTLRPIAKRIEAEDARKLFVGDPAGYRVRHKFRELLRADVKTMWDTYSKGRQFGIYSVNEIRRELGLPGIGPTGDVYHTPVNLAELGRRVVDDAIQQVGRRSSVAERRALVEWSLDGDEAVAERFEQSNDEQRSQLTAAIMHAIGRAAAELGATVDRDAVAAYAAGLAGDHCKRAASVVVSSPTDWIAAGRFEFEPGRAFDLLTFNHKGAPGENQ